MWQGSRTICDQKVHCQTAISPSGICGTIWLVAKQSYPMCHCLIHENDGKQPDVNGDKLMNCQNCGGPLSELSSPGRLLCSYCNTVNHTKISDSTPDRVVVLSELSVHSCPCCQQHLTKALIDDHAVEYCLKCKGILTPRNIFSQIVWQRRASYCGQEQQVQTPNPAEFKERRHCPGCAAAMETYPYYGPSNVVIDGCDRCEFIWLDGGELTMIERAPGQRQTFHQARVPMLTMQENKRYEAPKITTPINVLLEAINGFDWLK